MTPFRAAILADVRAWPGEYAPRRIVVGNTCVCEVPPSVGTNPPEREWAKHMREDGLLRPAKVRASAHMTAEKVGRMFEGRAKSIVALVFAAGAEGMAVGEIAKAIDGTDYPGGHLERELEALYHDGRLSPPAALWACE